MKIKIDVSAPDAPLLVDLMEHSLSNYGRVEALIGVYENITSGKKGKRSSSDIDVLRSAVVFIHATLEDGMRAVGRHYLPVCEREVLDKIPLVGINNSGKAEKFFLGRLSEHSSRLVSDLIIESVASHLDKTSYTSTSDISTALFNYGIDQTKIKPMYSILDEMIKRRHHIVHKGDKVMNPGPGKQYANSLSAKQVRKWNNTVNDFFAIILEEYVGLVFWPDDNNG